MEVRRYRIVSVLGKGGSGKVYRAVLEGPGGFHQDVALKVFRDEDLPEPVLRRTREDAHRLGLVRDRAIVGVDAPTRLTGLGGSTSGQRFWAAVMEFVDGASLQRLMSMGPMPAAVACEVVQELARVLDKVWKIPGPDGRPLQLMHRDVKPTNVQITAEGEVKLLDFGLPKPDLAARDGQAASFASGARAYVAPERLEGVDSPAGDVFSLGMTLHFMLTGERPSRKSAAEDPATQAMTADAFAMVALSARMRSTDPDERPSAREVEEECSRVRRRKGAENLRAWAGRHVPRAVALKFSDEMVGTVLAEAPVGSVPSEDEDLSMDELELIEGPPSSTRNKARSAPTARSERSEGPRAPDRSSPSLRPFDPKAPGPSAAPTQRAPGSSLERSSPSLRPFDANRSDPSSSRSSRAPTSRAPERSEGGAPPRAPPEATAPIPRDRSRGPVSVDSLNPQPLPLPPRSPPQRTGTTGQHALPSAFPAPLASKVDPQEATQYTPAPQLAAMLAEAQPDHSEPPEPPRSTGMWVGLAAMGTAVGAGLGAITVVLLISLFFLGSTLLEPRWAPAPPVPFAPSTALPPLNVDLLPAPGELVTPDLAPAVAIADPDDEPDVRPQVKPRPVKEVVPMEPPPPPVPGAPTREITFSSVPIGTDVYVDGIRIGQTPLVDVKLTEGGHQIKMISDAETLIRNVDVGRKKPVRYVWKGGDLWELHF